MTPTLTLSNKAVQRIKELVEKENDPTLMLRIFISGGGCSGFQYGFTFDDAEQDGDTKITNNGVSLLIDPMSFQYLMGAEIDYQETLQSCQFIINNPNAKSSCGCGSSFST